MQDSMSKDSVLKVAIIRLSSLGDIVSSIVFLDLLRTKFAQQGRKIDIAFIVDSQFRGILENSPLVDKIIDLPLRQSKKDKRLIFSVIKKVRSLWHFDKVIDAQGLLKSALIGKMLKKSAFIGYDKDSIREKIASFFYTKKATIAYNEHILKRQYELFKVAFDEVAWENDFRLEMLDSRECAMDSSPKAKAKIAQILIPHEANKKILFLCETSKADKEFSLTSFYALAQGLWRDYEDARIFLIWDKKEREIRALGKKDSRFCVLQHLDFDEIKALLASMDLVIGGDTGITHSAWAMRVPSVTIYVSTDMKRFALGGEKHLSLSLGNSPLELHSADFGIFEDFADFSPVSSPKIPKNHESQTENPSVVLNADSTESSLQKFKPHPKSLCYGEGLSYSPSLAVYTPPQTPPARGGAFSLSPSLACGDSKNSPSLAEGARGWVKTPSLRESVSNEASQRNNNVNCHNSAQSAESRNDNYITQILRFAKKVLL